MTGYDVYGYRYRPYNGCKPDRTKTECECAILYKTGPDAEKIFWVEGGKPWCPAIQ